MRPTNAVDRKPVRPPTGETWRAVLETGYQVSDQGRVRNAAGRVLELQAAGNPKAGRPYLRAELWCAGQRVTVFAHSLVALAFLGDPPAGAHVHHMNGNGRDNRAANLRYLPAHEHLSDHWRGESNPVAALTAADVLTIRRMLAEGRTEPDIAAAYGVSRGAISNIRLRRTWAHVEGS